MWTKRAKYIKIYVSLRGTNMIGLYIHIPFCAKKCDYCDFYSLNYNTETVRQYVDETCRRVKKLNHTFDTVYFGGGTPSLIGAENIAKILSCARKTQGAEVTVEVNPKSFKKNFFQEIFKAGVNRVSIGLQSANDKELKLLSRTHNSDDVRTAISLARQAGFENISLDVMIGIENQTAKSMLDTLEFCVENKATHVSCYMLKIEEGTPFSMRKLNLPDEDEVSDMYLIMSEYLAKNGYNHYEISNFALDGCESKHNLIYWHCDEYIGIGPSAHSLISNKRYYFPNDIKYYLDGFDMKYSEVGADLYDYIMLGLRLKEGISFSKAEKLGLKNKEKFIKKLEKYKQNELLDFDEEVVFLTEKGFLLQNTILVDLLEEI